jgi:hypothetical protein
LIKLLLTFSAVSAWNVKTLAYTLGSFPLSTELDTELVEHSMDNDESQASAVRKILRTQKLEGKECAA